MGEETTQPPAEAKTEKPAGKVRIKLLRRCLINKRLCEKGTEHMVSEDIAKELCDRKVAGYHPVYGYLPEVGPLMTEEYSGQPAMNNPMDRKQIVRAVRVVKAG